MSSQTLIINLPYIDLAHLLLGHIMQIRPQQLRPLNIIPPIKLLVDTMRGIRARPQRQQQHVLPRRLLERQRHRYAAPLPRQVRLHAIHPLHRPARRGVIPMFRGSDPPVAGMHQLHLERVLAPQLREFRPHVVEHAPVHLVGLHVRHRPDRELPDHLGRDDGLGARGGEGALDAVDAEGRVPPAGHQGGLLVREDGRRAAEGFVQVRHAVLDRAVEPLFLLRQRRHHLLDAGDLDLPVRVDEAGQHPGQIRHRFLRGPAEEAAVQILAGPVDGDGVVVAAAEPVREARFLGPEPVVVADADGVGVGEEAAPLGFLFDEFVQPLGAVFFHPLEAHEQVDGQLDPGFPVRVDGVQPAQHGALVVGAAAAVHSPLVVHGEGEGFGGPAVLLKGGLDVVVAVDEDGPFGWVGTVAGDDDRGELEVFFAGLEAERPGFDVRAQGLELRDEEFGHLG